MSGTRTVMIGLLLFLFFYFYFTKNYKFIFVILPILFYKLFTSGAFQKLFFDVLMPLEGTGTIDSIGSGRLGGWSQIVNNLLEAPLVYQLFGFGYSSFLFDTGKAHNDFLDLFICTGIIGSILYLLMLVSFFRNFSSYTSDLKLKAIAISFLISIFAMNFASNSYITRFEMVQYFMLAIAILYNMKIFMNKKQ